MNFKNSIGNIEVRLAETKEELDQLLKLRYERLILEYNPNNTNEMHIDYQPVDDVCDHFIAIDTSIHKIIGTYRLIRAEHIDRFFTEKEYDLTKLKPYKILEISRAVVDEAYRDGVAIQLLWKGIIQYAHHYDMDYMVGTASFYGLDLDEYNHAFTYLHHHYASPEAISCPAREPRADLNRLPLAELDVVLAKKQLPPLVKGYLRLGCTIGDGIYIDPPFNSVDVLIVLKIKTIDPRYLKKLLGLVYE